MNPSRLPASSCPVLLRIVVSFLLIVGGQAVCPAADELILEARENAGLERYGFPVAYRLELSRPVTRSTPFALHDDQGKPVIAQFSPATDDPMPAQWWLDFSAPLEPWQKRRYTVRYGNGVEPAGEGTGGHRLTENDRFYLVANAPYITWSVPRDLSGLLHSVDFPPDEHLRPDSPGLVLRDREGRAHVLGAGFHSGQVVRNGRRAVALRFTGEARDEALAGVRSTVDLTFPSPVSWIEVDWTVDDPQGRVAGLQSALRLALDAPRPDAPTLVDFGAGTWVYATLPADQVAELQAIPPARGDQRPDRAWRVLRGPADRMTPFAVAPAVAAAGVAASRAEGWAHIMDRRRCLALAIDRFARESADRVRLAGNGEVDIGRDFAREPVAPKPGVKRLRFWLHFVFYPPQQSAASSPYMMQTPPEISVVAPDDKR